METQEKNSTSTPEFENAKKREAWFDEIVAQIRTHQIMLETGTATPETAEFYKSMIDGTISEVVKITKDVTRKLVVPQMIYLYLKQLQNNRPIKLAVDYNDSEVLLWAEINDDDEAMEDVLIMAEAKVNAEFHLMGFDMISTIVEKSDCLKMPNHYKNLI